MTRILPEKIKTRISKEADANLADLMKGFRE